MIYQPNNICSICPGVFEEARVFTGGDDLKKDVVLLVLFVLAGMDNANSEDNYTAYENPTTVMEENLTFNMEQRISGTGFFTAYKYSQMPDVLGEEGRLYNGVEAKNLVHGSGKIEIDSLMHAESSYMNRTWVNGAYDGEGNVIVDEEEATSVIRLSDDSKMTYSPMAIVVGSRYYAAHPLAFNSMLSETIWIRNRDILNSISQRVDEAHGIGMLRDTQSDAVSTSMKLKQDMIDGKAHLGALQLARIPGDERSIELDQYYIGTYHLETNLNLNTYEEEADEVEEWLPCCSEGFLDVNPIHRVDRSVQDIFDCMCFRFPNEVHIET